jgi:6-phosphogluconolactonase
MGMVAGLSGASAAPAEGPKWHVYVGTYTRPGGSQGIYRLTFDAATGALSPAELVAETPSPSFLALHPARPVLCAVNELTEYAGEKAGSVSAFALDRSSGALKALNVVSSRGGAPCHLAIDRAGKHVVVANYVGGNVAVLPIREDGGLGDSTCLVQHEGKSVNPRRQEGPHAHGTHFDPAGAVLAVPDLGIDRVKLYRLDEAQGVLTANAPPAATVEPGSGPRHLAYTPDGKRAYVINEMASTVTVFDVDPGSGALTARQTISTLPEGFEGSSSTAEVVVHPSGRFVYGSNRGHDSLAIFAVDAASGELTAKGHQSTRGKTPRNFAIDPSGNWLVAANQDSDTLAVFRIDPATGGLSAVGDPVAVPMPVCVLFVPAG